MHDTRQRSDFLLEDDEPGVISGSASGETFYALNEQTQLLRDIRESQEKFHPGVLCTTQVSGSNPIPVGDVTPFRRIYFLLGGKPVTVYKTIMWSTYVANATASLVPMNTRFDGFDISPSAAGVINQLVVPISELYIAINPTQICPINGGAVSGAGGIFIYGFTIPDYDLLKRSPLGLDGVGIVTNAQTTRT